jgi:4-amino-4-deoxy-L-arabinose transferase-like glycosyltransferase
LATTLERKPDEHVVTPAVERSAVTFLLILGVVAFLIRLGAVLAMRDIHTGPTSHSSDDDVQFNTLALHTAGGQGFSLDDGKPTSFRAPGFPLFLAGVYFVAGGPNYPLAYVTFCLLGAVSCLLTYYLGRELLSERGARTAAVLHALYLGHIYFATVFLSENLYISLQTLGVWLYVRHLRHGGLGTLLGAAAVLGWAALTRPFALLLLPLLLLVLVSANRRHRRPVFVPCAALTAVFLAVITPWTVRNYHVHGRPVLIATNGGSTFYGANNDRVISEPRYFGYWLSTTELPHRDLIEATPDEVAHDKMEWKLGIDWVREHPGKAVLAVPLKVARLGIGLPDFDAGRWYYLLRIAGYVPFFFLCLLGTVRVLRNSRLHTAPWMTLHVVMAATLLTTVIFWGSPRFRDANVGVLMIYAAVGFHMLRPWRDDVAGAPAL